MTDPTPTTPKAPSEGLTWKWPAVLLCGWLLGAFFLMQPAALAPGRTLYVSDALLLSASSITGSGLSPFNVGAHFSSQGLIVLALLMQAGFITTLWVGAVVGTRLFEKFTTPQSPVDPTIARLGLWVVLAGQLALFACWVVWFKSAYNSETQTVASACFTAITTISTTGLWLTKTAGIQQSGLGQTVVLPLMIISAIGLIPLGDFLKYILSFGRHKIHPASRWILTCAGVTFLVGVGLLLVTLLVPHGYAFLHLGMESSASQTDGLTGQVIKDGLTTSSFHAGPGRLGMIESHAVTQQAPAFSLVMILLSVVGFAPLSMSGGVSALALGVLVYTWCMPWKSGNSKITCDCETIDMPRLTGWANSTLGYFLAVIVTSVFLLSLSEPYPAVTLFAEVVSAASNAGFSMGITSELTSFGKAILTGLMLLGRIAPFWLAVRFAR